MVKVASLALHKNRVEARRKKAMGREISVGIAKKVRDADIRAYAFVGIDSEGRSHCMWDTGATMPLWGFPAAVEAMLTRDIEVSGVKEDWKPPMRAFPVKS